MKEKIQKYFKEEGLYLGILAFMLICFFLPYCGEGFPSAPENDFHYARITSLVESLKLGLFPPKLRPMLMLQFGYGVGFFYPDFFFYFPVALIFLGMDPTLAIKIFIVLVAIAGAYITYRSLTWFVGSRNISLVMTILYFGTLCMWENLFLGGGFGAFIAQVALPMAFCGLIKAFDDDKKGYILYGVGIVIVVLSHHLTFISMMVAMVLIVLLNIKKLIANPKILGRLFAVSLVGLFFTAQYWLPAIELAAHTKFAVIYDNYIDINDHILNFKDVIREISPAFFIVFLIATVIFVVLMVKNKKIYWDALMVFVVTVFHMGLMRSEPFWRGPVGQFFSFFQSTSRLIYVLMAVLIIFVAMVLELLAKELKAAGKEIKFTPVVLAVIGVVIALATRFYLKTDFYDAESYGRQVLETDLIENNQGISCGEWLPVENEPSECHDPNNALASDGTSADGFKHDKGKYFEVWVNLDKEYYDMPYIYYYGYRAYILDDNGNPVKELSVGEALDDNGYVRVYMPEGESGVGHVMVTYKKTLIQKIAYIITLLTTVLFIGYLIIRRRKAVNAG